MTLDQEKEAVEKLIKDFEHRLRWCPAPSSIRSALGFDPFFALAAFASEGRIYFNGKKIGLPAWNQIVDRSELTPKAVEKHEEILAIYDACIKRDGPPIKINCGT